MSSYRKVNIYRIGEICDKIHSGGTPSTRNKEEYYGGNIPWLRSGEINFNSITNTEMFITELAIKNSSAKWVRNKSVLIALTGATVARTCVNEISLTTNQSCCALETNESIINYKFLYYYLASKYFEIKSMAQGALTSLNLDLIRKITIPVPIIKVQEEIVKILDSFTNLIDALNEELSLRQKQFEYYREKLLTFDDNVNWDLFDNIGEITDYVANGSFADLKKNVKYLQESNYAILVRTLDLSSNFKNNNFVYIDKNAYDFLEKSKLFGGEIIINNVGAGVGTVFCCPKLERKMSLGPNSVVLKTNNNKFYYYWLSSKQGQDKIFQITSFSALPKFNKGLLN